MESEPNDVKWVYAGPNFLFPASADTHYPPCPNLMRRPRPEPDDEFDDIPDFLK
ncbi:hypothetical protein [Streptomyces sp. NPDC049555]|uniref:hypothetical protein n=1 Tax=unclassified Streptomyces TaxID=2593676 RepID=UPI00342580A1